MGLVGMHDEEGAFLTPDGYVLVTVEVSWGGKDFSHLKKPICRLNHGYHPEGTIPRKVYYAQFAGECGEFVKHSQGCRIWIIGNEPNLSHEWPHGEPITASDYARCFTLCREAIKRVQPEAVVIPAPIGPWNMESGDWLAYFRQTLSVPCDGIALHTYGDLSHAYMQSMPNRRYGFWAYKDFLAAIPEDKRGLPVYITEANPNMEWYAGWLTGAVREVTEPIECLLPYCYIHRDKFGIQGNSDVEREIERLAGEYVSMSGWGIRSRTEQIVIHHSATAPTVTEEAIRSYHLSKGYAGIAYHALVYPDGRWKQVNPWDALSWHAGCGYDTPLNANAYSIGVCLLGDFTKQPPPEQQLQGARELVAHLMGLYGELRVIGHREAYKVSTACPGNAFTPEMVGSLLPAVGAPELAEKLRWFAEEVTRRIEASDYTGALDILYSLVEHDAGLCYQLERLLKQG
jgi:hypothetical protein